MDPQNCEGKTQPVPAVTADDVVRIVRRDFPSDQFESVIQTLAEYGLESWHREPYRVRLAVLKLAQGDARELRCHLDIAKRDYRDVLACAEYPNYMRKVPPSQRVEGKSGEHIIEQDWQQYRDWLERT